MAFDKFPEELKIQMFSHLRILKRSNSLQDGMLQWDSPVSLLNATLCCRNWNELVTPLLYSTFADERSNITKFLRTILERPDLACYVKTYSSDCPWVDILDVDLLEPYHVKIENVIPAEFKSEVGLTNWNGVHWKTVEEITALILLLLPNLSTLALSNRLQQGTCTSLVLATAARFQNSGEPTPYCNFQQIEIYRFDDGNSFFGAIEPFLPLKSVNSLIFNDMTMGEQRVRGVGVFAPHITHLSFPKDDIHPQTLVLLLRYFPHLTHFSYIHKGRIEEPYPFIGSAIRDGIMHLQPSLEELVILDQETNPEEEYDRKWKEDLHEIVPVSQDTEKGSLSLGSLKGFRRLRRLEATFFTLVGPIPRAVYNNGGTAVAEEKLEQKVRLLESLPDSFEELILWKCNEETEEVVKLLFDRKRRGQLRKLKMVDLVFVEIADIGEPFRRRIKGKELGVVVNARADKGLI
ncbi:hypothetical protein N431DRAFT_474145 [Stipitochalara longipes BDJ]|nr:hypothetical protein N431DRAFT_474145 [Stipitochalara longipes BDJ]